MLHGLTKLLVQVKPCLELLCDQLHYSNRYNISKQKNQLIKCYLKALHDKCLNIKIQKSVGKGGNDIIHLEHGFHPGFSVVINVKKVHDLKAYLYMCAITTVTSSLLAWSSISIKCLNWDSLGESKQQSNVFIRHQSTHQQLFTSQRPKPHTTTARGTCNLMELHAVREGDVDGGLCPGVVGGDLRLWPPYT